jgi:hypothetical protein
VRVGENSDDITEECFGEYDWDWVRVHRESCTATGRYIKKMYKVLSYVKYVV